jgi:shikimate dehydrogenase
MNNKKLIWGLIGNGKIKNYSIAPEMWAALFLNKKIEVDYFILSGDLSSNISPKLKEYLKKENFVGCNIAMPWKYLGYEFCNYAEDSVNRVEAINTLIKRGEVIEGYNTDGLGMVNGIKKFVNLKEKKILILGCGSSAQTIPFHLINNNVNKIYILDIVESRPLRISKKYSDISRKKGIPLIPIKRERITNIIKDIDILINTTPCGMKGFHKKYPLKKELLNKLKISCVCVETIYTPYETPLLKYVKKRGNLIIPGVIMLVEQAALSFEYAFEKKLNNKDKRIMEKAAINALKTK